MKRSRRFLVPLCALLLGGVVSQTHAESTTRKRLVLHGVECVTQEDCAAARAVVVEAVRTLRDDESDYDVVTDSASLVRSQIVAAGIAPERIHVRAGASPQCIAALSAFPCQ